MVVSASRRTDIPSFYSRWFFRRISEGFAMTRNPFNPAQERRVPLSPEDVDCIVFWTKDPAPMIDRLEELDNLGYAYYFQFSLTPYGRQLERNLRAKEDIIETFRELSGRVGRKRVLWRYDPIILNSEIGADYHTAQFEKLCGLLSGFTERVTISFVSLYAKIKTTQIREISPGEKESIAGEFARIGAAHGIDVRSCCEDLAQFGIAPAACIDGDLVREITGRPYEFKRDTGQRAHCRCIQSVDIGAYNTCGNGCVYCYANHSAESVARNMARHEPEGRFLLCMN